MIARHQLLFAGLVLAFTFDSCSPGGGPGGNSQSPASDRIAAARERPPCPPEQLSCGLQQPVLSDGVRRFENEEMGISAIFPGGSGVCLARSGDAARGFYAWYGTEVSGCPERGDLQTATHMAVSASFNAPFYQSVREAVMSCLPLSSTIVRRLGGARLAFSGHDSIACRETGRDGSIRIGVHALGGRFPDEEPDVPHVIYYASLETRLERLDRDLAMFRDFLAGIRIGRPE